MCRHMVHACLGTLARLNEEDKKRRLIYANDVDEDPILVVRLLSGLQFEKYKQPSHTCQDFDGTS